MLIVTLEVFIISKIACETYIQEFSKIYNLKYRILRYGSIEILEQMSQMGSIQFCIMLKKTIN